ARRGADPAHPPPLEDAVVARHHAHRRDRAGRLPGWSGVAYHRGDDAFGVVAADPGDLAGGAGLAECGADPGLAIDAFHRHRPPGTGARRCADAQRSRYSDEPYFQCPVPARPGGPDVPDRRVDHRFVFGGTAGIFRYTECGAGARTAVPPGFRGRAAARWLLRTRSRDRRTVTLCA